MMYLVKVSEIEYESMTYQQYAKVFGGTFNTWVGLVKNFEIEVFVKSDADDAFIKELLKPSLYMKTGFGVKDFKMEILNKE